MTQGQLSWGVVVLLLATTPAAAEGLVRTQPGHLDPRPQPPLTPGIAPKPSTDKAQPITVLRSDKLYTKVLKYDAVLSAGCRAGTFDMMRPNRFVARFTNAERPALFEVVPESRRDLLVDRQGLARPGEDYFFLNAGWSNCQVYYMGKLPPRVPRR